MRLAIVGPSGSGKTTLAHELAAATGARHVEIDALWHGPDWQDCGADELRRRVAAAIEGDGWISDGTYHTVIGDLVLERAQTIAWLDLPVRVVMWRLVRRTFVRKRKRVVLWNGNVEDRWLAQVRWLFWPALMRAFENRRQLPARFARHQQLTVHRLRSDGDVRAFAQSIQATASTSGSSNGSERQKTPPSTET